MTQRSSINSLFDLRARIQSERVSTHSRKIFPNLKFNTISEIVLPKIETSETKVVKRFSLDTEPSLNYKETGFDMTEKLEMESIEREKMKLLLDKYPHIEKERKEEKVEIPTIKSMKSTVTLKDIRKADKIKTKKTVLSTSSNNLKVVNFLEP